MGMESGREGQTSALPHKLVLEQGRLTVTGVTEVLQVEESMTVMKAGGQLLLVRGTGLTLRQLTPDDGKVEVRGEVAALSYERAAPSGGLLRRLFG